MSVICNYCGAPLTDSEVSTGVCPYCGRPLSGEEPKQKEVPAGKVKLVDDIYVDYEVKVEIDSLLDQKCQIKATKLLMHSESIRIGDATNAIKKYCEETGRA